MLEAKLACTCEELEEEHGTHGMEDLERADQEHTEDNEWDQAFHNQLNNITMVLQQQADQCEGQG